MRQSLLAWLSVSLLLYTLAKPIDHRLPPRASKSKAATLFHWRKAKKSVLHAA